MPRSVSNKNDGVEDRRSPSHYFWIVMFLFHIFFNSSKKWSSNYRFYSLHFHSLFLFSLSLPFSHSSSSLHFPFFVTQPRAVVPILFFFIVVSLGTFQPQSCFFFSFVRFRFVFLLFIPQLPSVLCLFFLFVF